MFKPVNRYIEIALIAEEKPKTESGILLPEDFKPAEERYAIAQVLSVSEDVKFKESLTSGSTVVVDKSMIEAINFNNKSINVVLENYILGIIS
jgi:co-chaperonin GroES (HSP10)